MSLSTGVLSGDNLIQNTLDSLKSTQAHFKIMQSGGHFFCYGNRTTPAIAIDTLRWLSELHSNVPGGLTLRNLLLNAVVSSETKQSSSGSICLHTLLCILQIFLKNQYVSKKISDYDAAESLKVLSQSSYRPTSNEIFSLLKKISNNDDSYKIAKEAISLAGANGTITVNPEASTKTTTIQKIFGYNFPIEVPDVFLSASGLIEDKTLLESKSIVIDGIIENVSEISGLVHTSYEKNQPLVIVARGFSDDVQNTLGVNFSTGNLSIIPVTVHYDAFGANLLNDICATIGSDIVSSLKGDLISSIKWEDIATVEKIVISSKRLNLTIVNSRAKNNVERHRAFLRNKRKNVSASNFQESLDWEANQIKIFDKRLQCLAGSGVIITLGTDLQDLWGITKDRIDSQIKMFKDASKFGIINLDLVIEKISDPLVTSILKNVKKTSNLQTARSLLLGLKIGIDTSLSLSKLGGVVYLDR